MIDSCMTSSGCTALYAVLCCQPVSMRYVAPHCAVLPHAVLCSFYGESIPGNVLCERIASYKHLFNLYWYTR